MRVRTEVGKLNGVHRRLMGEIERLRQALEIDPVLWGEILDTSPKAYESAVSGEKAISLRSLELLTDYLDVSMEALMRGELDHKALVARIRGDLTVLPECYANGAFSRRRTSINVLAYLERFHSWGTMKRALRKLQVHEAAFSDPEQLISLRFLTDLCTLLMEWGASDDTFRSMGHYSAITNQGTHIAKVFAQARGLPELYSMVIEQYAGSYDTNYDYTIQRLGNDGAVIVAEPNEAVCDALGTHAIGSAAVCTTKSGGYSTVASYIGSPAIRVRETACIHRGDAQCQFYLDFESVAHDARLATAPGR